MELDLTCKECGHIEKIEFSGTGDPILKHAVDVNGIHHYVSVSSPIKGTFTFHKTKE